MEKLIAGLFDFQKFAGDPKLAEVIERAHAAAYAVRPLDDSEADIWAAGEPIPDVPPTEDRHD